MSKTSLFLGGLPTEPDVKRLIEAFETPAEGRIIAHGEIGAIIGHDHRSNRYRSVVGAWRQQLLKLHNIELEAVPGVGYKALAPHERMTASIRGYGRGVRKIGRSVTSIRRVPVERLDADRKRVAEHATRHMEATLTQARADSKSIAFEFKPQDRLPRSAAK